MWDMQRAAEEERGGRDAKQTDGRKKGRTDTDCSKTATAKNGCLGTGVAAAAVAAAAVAAGGAVDKQCRQAVSERRAEIGVGHGNAILKYVVMGT